MTTPARVVIVGCGFPQLGLVRAARELGLDVIGIDANPRAIGAAECSEFHEVSTHDVDGIAEVVQKTRGEGITTCGSEIALASTARVAEQLGLPFYGDVATVDRCQAKDQMRAAYRQGGAPIPAFSAVTVLAEAEAFVEGEGLPVVVKPSRGWGQRGVSKVEKRSELADAFERARAASSAGIALIEAFIDGREFSVNAYTANGTTTVYSVTERIITHYPDPPGITFAEWFPSGLHRADEARAAEAALCGVRALGIRRGPSYTQLRVGSRGPMIVETAYRLGGGLDPDVALLASGSSLFRKILGVALSREDWERAGPERTPHGGAIGKFLIGQPGHVAAIHGLQEARSMPGIIAAEVYVEPGGTVFPLTDGSKRAGHVLAVGGDRDEANARAEAAAGAIRIETV
ncbi:MAG TPA: ATP-grasp domain-containing protein [Polyangiaceae bacterium]|nr:ATP-grasp domain-containing protein [Polyangiaceae bacterium]